jgi:hypothetical protein
MAEHDKDKDPRPAPPPQPTQHPYDPRNPLQTPRAPGEYLSNDPRLEPRLPYDPRNPQGLPERSQVDISREAKPGTPASRDAIAARHPKMPEQQAGASARSLEPPPEPNPIYAPAAHAIPLSSTTAAARPPEGPLTVTLYSVADPNTTMQVMPIDAQDHIASGEWTLAPAGEVPPIGDTPQSRRNPS